MFRIRRVKFSKQTSIITDPSNSTSKRNIWFNLAAIAKVKRKKYAFGLKFHVGVRFVRTVSYRKNVYKKVVNRSILNAEFFLRFKIDQFV